MRFTFRLFLAFAATVASASATNAAPLIIDSFTQGSYMAGDGMPKTVPPSLVNTTNIFTDVVGQRTISHFAVGPQSPTFGTVEGVLLNFGSAAGALELSSGTSTAVAVQLDYAFAGALILDAGTGFILDFGGIEAGLGTTDLTVDVLINGTISSTFDINELAPQPVTLFDPSFTGINITSLQFILNAKGTLGTDFTLLEIRAEDGEFVDIDEVIPEPVSMVVFGALALGGLAVARRKMLAKKASVA